MRIAIGGIIHETSTFVRTRTTLADFAGSRGITRGAEILATYTGTNVCTGGFLEGARRFDFEPVPLLRADAWPGGLIVRADYEALRDELCERLRQADAEARLDGVLLDLHGAMVVDGIDDGDGDVVAAVRKALGPDRPIVYTQDLHGNHTKLRVKRGDALIGFDTFPHVDMAERGLEAAEVIARTVRGELRPVMAIHQLPLFWATSKQVTAHPPMDEVIRQVHALEQRPGIVSVTVATGFPWADVPEVGSSVVVVADGNRELAQQTADELAAWIWERRDRWYAEPVTVRDGLAEGERLGRYPSSWPTTRTTPAAAPPATPPRCCAPSWTSASPMLCCFTWSTQRLPNKRTRPVPAPASRSAWAGSRPRSRDRPSTRKRKWLRSRTASSPTTAQCSPA